MYAFLICCYHLPKPIYSACQFSDESACVFATILICDEDGTIVDLAGDSNQSDTDFLCYDLWACSALDGHILDKFLTNGPDIYNNCFPMKSTVNTKNLAVCACSNYRLVNRNTRACRQSIYVVLYQQS
jgi:hypothetical protein